MPDFVGYARDKKASDEKLLRQARERLEAARKFRRKDREQDWKRSEDQYAGNHWLGGSDDPAADLITVNVSFSTVNTIRPFITAEQPHFLVEPYSLDSKLSNARMQAAWLNRFWRSRSSGAQKSLELATEDKLTYGDGYLKVTHVFVEKPVRGTTDQFTDIVEIYVDKVSPWDVWIDPNADGIHNARYVIHRIFLTREEMEADEERYGDVNLDELPWGNVEYASEDSDFNQDERLEGEANYMAIYEYWDQVTETMLVFAEAADTPLLRVVDDVQAPLVQVANYRKFRSPYHYSELEQIWDVQQELNKSRSELATHRRRNIAKYAVREDAIDEDGYNALQSPIVGEAIPIKVNEPLNNVIAPLQVAPLPPEAYASADQALRDVYEITGVNEYLRGATPEIRRTATEASIIEGASNVKVQAKLAQIEEAAREAGTILLAVAKAVFPETDVDEMGLLLTGEEAKRTLRASKGEEAASLIEAGGDIEDVAALGQPDPIEQDAEFRPTEEIFEGEYEVFVETHSTELRNPIFKEQKAREMAQALTSMAGPLSQMGIPLNLRKALELWFDAAGISDIEGMFEQNGPPQMPPGQPQPGAPQEAGAPNLQGAQPPIDAIVPDNSGQLLPTQ